LIFVEFYSVLFVILRAVGSEIPEGIKQKKNKKIQTVEQTSLNGYRFGSSLAKNNSRVATSNVDSLRRCYYQCEIFATVAT